MGRQERCVGGAFPEASGRARLESRLAEVPFLIRGKAPWGKWQRRCGQSQAPHPTILVEGPNTQKVATDMEKVVGSVPLA